MELLFQPRLHDFRQFRPVDLMGLVVADLGQRLVAVLDDRGAFVRPHRGYLLHHVGYHVGVFHYDLIGLVAPQVIEFLQHLLRGVQEQGRLLVSVLKAPAGHDDAAVDLVLGI